MKDSEVEGTSIPELKVFEFEGTFLFLNEGFRSERHLYSQIKDSEMEGTSIPEMKDSEVERTFIAKGRISKWKGL